MLHGLNRIICLVRVATHLSEALVRVFVFFPWISAIRRRHQIESWSRSALVIFGLRLIVSRAPNIVVQHPSLLVCNHVSWLDIFAIWAATDTVFVAKSDVARWPVIGFLARHLNVIFVDRAKRTDVIAVGKAISNALRNGRSVCIFPEGTTTDGRELQSFRTALFQPAIDQGVPVRPLAIRYFRADGQRAKEAAFVGDMSLAQSIWGLAAAVPITIDVSLLPSLNTTGLERRPLAKAAEASVRDALFEPAPDLVAADRITSESNSEAAVRHLAYPTP